MPALNGNWVDLAIIVFGLFYVCGAWYRGFLSLVAEMVGFVGSFLLALHFYPYAGRFLIANFTLSQGIANGLGFVGLAIGLEMILGLALNLLFARLPQKILDSKVNKLLGFIPASVDALILISFILSLVLALPIPKTYKKDISSSKVGSYILSQTGKIEKSLTEVFGGVTSETLNFLTVAAGSKDKVPLKFTVGEYEIDPQTEAEMLVLVNKERTGRGLKALIVDEKIRTVARAHSQDMFVRSYFSHENPDGNDTSDRMEKAGIKFRTAGENIALTPTLNMAHEGLMNSPGHRENILNPDFSRIGIGVIDGGLYGKMFTQDFAD